MEFREKFIAFLDVLGFKAYVRSAEAGSGKSLPEILEILKKLGSADERDHFSQYGPIICPDAPYLQKNLDFRCTQISDCAVLSAEVSPAGVINLVDQCRMAVFRLLQAGAMCRGYITRGMIFHSDTQFVGSGYQEAYERESQVAVFKREADERGTPFVEVAPSVLQYVASCEDSCVQEMFKRMVRRDGDAAAVFPFKMLSHSFVIGDFLGQKFDAERERESNQNMRLILEKLVAGVRASVDPANSGALRKAEHYIGALEAQIEICDRTDRVLDELSAPWPRRRM
jgi:hypothetical protein